jgi:hypothetical protein
MVRIHGAEVAANRSQGAATLVALLDVRRRGA